MTENKKALILIIHDAIKCCDRLSYKQRYALMSLLDKLFKCEDNKTEITEDDLDKACNMLLHNDLKLIKLPPGTTEIFLQEDLGLSDEEVEKYRKKAREYFNSNKKEYEKWLKGEGND